MALHKETLPQGFEPFYKRKDTQQGHFLTCLHSQNACLF